MQSKAATVPDYIAELPEERRLLIDQLRAVVNQNLRPGFVEGMQYGMIGWFVPHSIYPPGYHADIKQPLPFMALASQKQKVSLYLNCLHSDAETEKFRKAWLATGRRLDMGKCCVRIKRIEDAALDVIASWVASIAVDDYVRSYEKAIGPVRRAKR